MGLKLHRCKGLRGWFPLEALVRFCGSIAGEDQNRFGLRSAICSINAKRQLIRRGVFGDAVVVSRGVQR